MMHLEIVDEKLAQQIERLAAQEQRAPEQVIAEAVRLYGEHRSRPSASPFLLSIAGIGRSGQRDISEHAEEILAAEVDPARLLSRHSDEHNPHVVNALDKLADALAWKH